MINEKIIVALDTDSVEQARTIITVLGEKGIFYKVGISLFTKAGPDFIKEIVGMGKKVFLDMKFFDIPNSMLLASIAGAELGVEIINYHCLAGEKPLKEVKDLLTEYCSKKSIKLPYLIGVTVLTSVENEGNMKDVVLRMCHIAKNAGLDGVVCSTMELNAIKEQYGIEFKTVVPGIRMPENQMDDQKRSGTPFSAFTQGADYIVVGRPIIKAVNPRNALENIIADAEKALV